MKKSLLALAVLGAYVGVASAQSSVTLYGTADLNGRYIKNDGSKGRYSLSQDGINSSQLGFRGIEDLGGGYNAEAQRKYASIIHDIEKRDYHPGLRWMVYDGYGQALAIARKKDKAIAMLTRAAEIAGTLSDSERKDSARHLEAAHRLK